MDFRAEVIRALDVVIASGAVEKAIAANIATTIETVIKDQLRTYSEFGKQIESAIKGALKVGAIENLPSYSDAILKVIRRQVEHLTADTIQRQVATNMEKLLAAPPAEIRLSELVEAYRKQLEEEVEEGDFSDEHTMTFRCDLTDHNFTYIELDPKPNTPKYKCAIRFGIHHETIFSLNFDRKDMERELFVGDIHGFERLLFQASAAKTRVILDLETTENAETFYGHSL